MEYRHFKINCTKFNRYENFIKEYLRLSLYCTHVSVFQLVGKGKLLCNIQVSLYYFIDKAKLYGVFLVSTKI